MRKKGQIAQLSALVGPLVGVAIVLAIGFLIFAQAEVQIEDQESMICDGSLTNNTHACNGTMDVRDAMSDIPGWLPIIIITLIGAILLGLVAMFKGGR